MIFTGPWEQASPASPGAGLVFEVWPVLPHFFPEYVYRVAHMFSSGFIVVKPSKAGGNIWATL